MNDADPTNTPVALSTPVALYVPATGVLANTLPGTCNVRVTLLTPFEAVIVNVSSVELVAD